MKKFISFILSLILAVVSIHPVFASSTINMAGGSSIAADSVTQGLYTATMAGMSARELWYYGLIDLKDETNEKTFDLDSVMQYSEFQKILRKISDTLNLNYKPDSNTKQLTGEDFEKLLSNIFPDASVPETEDEVLTKGNVYLLLTEFFDGNNIEFPDTDKKAFEIPQKICVTAESLEDALEKIEEAMAYAPFRITVSANKSVINELKTYHENLNYEIKNEIFKTERPYSKYLEIENSTISSYINTDGDFTMMFFNNYRTWIYLRLDAEPWLTVLEKHKYTEQYCKFIDEKILILKDLDTVEMIQKTVEEIGRLADYDHDHYDEIHSADTKCTNLAPHRMTTVFDTGKFVCTGYAELFLSCMAELDIPCVLVSNNGHIWNKAKVNDQWYNVDACWADHWKATSPDSSLLTNWAAIWILQSDEKMNQDETHANPNFSSGAYVSTESLLTVNTDLIF